MKWTAEEEEAIVSAAQAGDLAAFDQLAAHYRPGAVLIARQIVASRDGIEDVVQDSFLAAYKALPQLRNLGGFAYWMAAIVRHRSRRFAAGERRAPLPLDQLILIHAPSIGAHLESRHQSSEIACAVRGLPDELRPIAELYYFDDWSVGEISTFLSLPATTVKWRLNTLRNRLRKTLSHLEEEFYG